MHGSFVLASHLVAVPQRSRGPVHGWTGHVGVGFRLLNAVSEHKARHVLVKVILAVAVLQDVLHEVRVHVLKVRRIAAEWLTFVPADIKTDINPFTPKSYQVQISPCGLRNITSHSMKNLVFHSLLRWKMSILPNSYSLLVSIIFVVFIVFLFFANETMWTIFVAEFVVVAIWRVERSFQELKGEQEIRRTIKARVNKWRIDRQTDRHRQTDWLIAWLIDWSIDRSIDLTEEWCWQPLVSIAVFLLKRKVDPQTYSYTIALTPFQ